MADDDENVERRAEELDALRSFYGDDLISDGSDCAAGDDATVWKIRVASKTILEVHLPPAYPATDVAMPKLVAPPWALDEGRKADILEELHEMIVPGMETAILWAEHCRAELGGDDRDVDDNSGDVGNDDAEPPPSASPQHDVVIAVVEFHHMLIGPSHKKEALALSAAVAYGIQGHIFMGGPSFAIAKSANKQDLIDWLQECKKAGKVGNIGYWRTMPSEDVPAEWPNKLKVMGYVTGGGKGDKPDMDGYKMMLLQLDISYPLPSCPELQCLI